MEDKKYSLEDEEVSIHDNNGTKIEKPEKEVVEIELNREQLNHIIVSLYKQVDIMVSKDVIIVTMINMGFDNPENILNQALVDDYLTLFPGKDISLIELTNKGKQVWYALQRR